FRSSWPDDVARRGNCAAGKDRQIRIPRRDQHRRGRWSERRSSAHPPPRRPSHDLAAGLTAPLRVASLYVVGEGVLFGRTLAAVPASGRPEPLTALPRSARSRVSSTRSFERPTRTPSPPCTDL